MALAGAAVAMLVCGPEVETVLHEVEWPTILFFVGLFVMVGALESTGFIEIVAHSLASASGSLAGTAMIVMWGSGFASGVVDNIPFTATMIPVIEGAGRIARLRCRRDASRCGGRSLWARASAETSP